MRETWTAVAWRLAAAVAIALTLAAFGPDPQPNVVIPCADDSFLCRAFWICFC